MSNSPGGQGSGGGNNPGAGGGSHNGQGNQAPEGGGGTGGTGSETAPRGKAGLGESQQLKPGRNASATSEDESSSPLVPILIAIAVLAAISIGAFYYRQRRQGADSSASPKAS